MQKQESITNPLDNIDMSICGEPERDNVLRAYNFPCGLLLSFKILRTCSSEIINDNHRQHHNDEDHDDAWWSFDVYTKPDESIGISGWTCVLNDDITSP